MILRRIIWIILIIISFLLYIFVNSPGTLTVFISLLVIPAVSFVLMRIGHGRCYRIISQDTAVKNAEIPVRLSAKKGSSFFTSASEVELNFKNIRTGEEESLELNAAAGKDELSTCFSSAHSVTVEISIDKIRIKDILGLFRKDSRSDEKKKITVMPEIFPMEISLTSGSSAFPEGDRYSRTKTGEDSAEIMGIREYVPGDPVKNMHWKLSGKTDKLLVKEFGSPVVNQVGVFLDMSSADAPVPAETDIAASVFATILDTFLKEDILPVAGWQDPADGSVSLFRLNTREEMNMIMREAMDVPVTAGSINISSAAEAAGERHGFAHVIVVGLDSDIDTTVISNGADSTLIVPFEGAGVGKGAGHLLAFSKESYRNELAFLNL